MGGRFRDVERSDITIRGVGTIDELKDRMRGEDVGVVGVSERNSGRRGVSANGAIDGI